MAKDEDFDFDDSEDIKGRNFLSDDDDMGQPVMASDNLKFLQDNQTEIFHVIMSLKRKTLGTDGKYRSQKGMKPMLNNKGIQYIKTILDSSLTKISSLSTFSEDDVSDRATSMTFAIIDNFQLNFKNYDIEKGDLSTIVRILNNLVYSHYSRARLGADKKFLSGVYGVTEHVTRKETDSVRM